MEMANNKLSLHFCALLVLLSSFKLGSAQRKLLIDVERDIPDDGIWDLECPNGYANFSTDYKCDVYGEGINIPPEDLNGELGFWTKCDYRCMITYQVQPGDVSFKARIYQRGISMEVSYDGVVWDFVEGEGWIELSTSLKKRNGRLIMLRLDHFSENLFTAIDKMVLNGDFEIPVSTESPPSTEPPPSTEAPPSTELPPSTEPTTTTTELPPITTESPPATTEPTSDTTSYCIPTTPEPEPCNCCDRCSQKQIQQFLHHHHHYYS